MSPNYRPLYIFDLDGTLADCEHRRPLLPNWDAFYEACDADPPIMPVLRLFKQLEATSDRWIFSGRSTQVLTKTRRWLERHDAYPERLEMRVQGDFTPDEVLKLRWYDEMHPYDKNRLVMIFDDRTKMVDAWRKRGLLCAQVAPGNF